MLTEVRGVRVGHWTDPVARTGCTVVLLPEGTVASGEVRGGAPATRDFELLAPERTVDRIDAVVLSGGSAFGLAAADGVMGVLEEAGVGFRTPAGPVPIVVGLSLFDLLVGDAHVRPGAAEGAAAARAATDGPVELGLVGAGGGATAGKWRGIGQRVDTGLGGAVVRHGDLVVAALIAVNAFGAVDHGGSVPDDALDWVPQGFGPPAGAGAEAPAGDDLPARDGGAGAMENTTIGLVVTNARLDKVGCLVAAQGGHDGLGRALLPPHTRVDGDALVVAATGEVEAPVDQVRLLTVAAVERAVRSTTPA